MSKMPRGKPFEPGNPGGPGRPRNDPLLESVKKLNRQEFERLMNMFLQKNSAELNEALKDPESNVLELMVGKIIAIAVNEGDQKRLDFILDRLLGKPKQEVDLSVGLKPYVIEKRDGSIVELGARVVSEDEE